jgi:mono/diheme cytochrome c family protein
MTRRLLATTLASALAAFGSLPAPASADDAQIERGRYLIVIAGCSDCHTPDMKRYLGGSDVGFAIPGAGVFVGENLTPDKETGLGDWTREQIIAAIRTGKTPEGRDLSPVMPYAAFSHLTDADAEAIAAFLKSLPPISNKVKNFGPKAPVTVNVSAVLPPNVYNALPASQK